MMDRRQVIEAIKIAFSVVEGDRCCNEEERLATQMELGEVLQWVKDDCTQWTRVEDTWPPKGQLVKVCGDSGYRTHTKFLTTAFIDEHYPHMDGGLPRWLGVDHDPLTDCGWRPTHWALIEPGDLP